MVTSVPGQSKPELKNPDKNATLTGRILAEVGYTTGYLRGALGDRFEVFVFAVERATGDVPVTPVKVMFKFYPSESPLPTSFFNYSFRYELQLTREPSCDETVQSLSYEKNADETGKALPPAKVLRFLDGAPKDVLKPDAVLACYVLRPGNYRISTHSEGAAPSKPTTAD
jgi:hypothetical protein